MHEREVLVGSEEPVVDVVATKGHLFILTSILLLGCQVQVQESTPGANVCRNPPQAMLLDYQNDVETQVIQGVCFECHNADGVARRISYSGNSVDNFCITYALGPNHPNHILSTYPLSPGHEAASGRTFTPSQIQPLIEWVNRYAR